MTQANKPLQRHTLDLFREVVEQLRAGSATSAKLDILRDALQTKDQEGEALALYFRMALDPFLVFHLKSDKLGVPSHTDARYYNVGLLSALDQFADRQISGAEQKAMWRGVLNKLPPHLRPIANDILDKDLGARIDVIQINKVFKEFGYPLITEFSCALGTPYEKDKRTGKLPELFTEGKKWVWSRKFDGLRGLVHCLSFNREPSKTLTRKGHEYQTLDKLNKIAAKWCGFPVVLDCEIALAREDGRDDFPGILKQWARKNHTIEHPRAYVFDAIPLHEFESGEGEMLFSTRQRLIDEILDEIDPEREFFVRVPQIRCHDEEQLLSLRQTAAVLDEEGGILRLIAPYKGYRSKDIWKVKTFEVWEFVCTGITRDSVRSVTRAGREVKIQTMGCALIQFKGAEVGVGGFKHEELDAFYEDEELIVGKTISVRHFGETTDAKTGKPSLRFPTYRANYGEERNV